MEHNNPCISNLVHALLDPRSCFFWHSTGLAYSFHRLPCTADFLCGLLLWFWHGNDPTGEFSILCISKSLRRIRMHLW
jgi:hypothetical protein